MRRMGLGGLLVCAAAIALDTGTAQACDCRRPPEDPASFLRHADLVFTGKALFLMERSEHVTITRDGSGEGTVRPLESSATFEVTGAWKGVRTGEVTVQTDGSDCSYRFEPGHRYLIFATRQADGKPYASICSHTTEFDKADPLLHSLGEPSFQSTP